MLHKHCDIVFRNILGLENVLMSLFCHVRENFFQADSVSLKATIFR